MSELSGGRARKIAVAAQGLHVRTPADGAAGVLRAVGTITSPIIPGYPSPRYAPG